MQTLFVQFILKSEYGKWLCEVFSQFGIYCFIIYNEWFWRLFVSFPSNNTYEMAYNTCTAYVPYYGIGIQETRILGSWQVCYESGGANEAYLP